MKAKKILCLVLVAILALGTLSLTSCGKAKYTVGICQLAPHVALDAATEGFKKALTDEFGDDVEFKEQNAAGSSDQAATIVGTFVDQKVDLIMANATGALQAAANATEDIPILGTSITEYGIALGLDDFDGKVIGNNISGTSDIANLEKQAQMIIDLVPDAKKVAMLYCSAEPNSKYQIEEVTKYLEAKGITCVDYSFADSNDALIVAPKAADAADAIYIPTDNTAASCAQGIWTAIADKGTPVIAGEEGICSGTGIATMSIDYYELGYMTGEMAVKILKGEAEVSEMAIQITPDDKLQKKYNEEICKALNVDIDALKEAGYVAIAEAEDSEAE